MLETKPMKYLCLIALLIFGFSASSTNLFPEFVLSAPIANAGADKTIYLTETNAVTLDGSASLGDSFKWTEISTDYMSGATIASPNSKVTTVIGLPQGVFYFELAATSGGFTKYDSVKVVVDAFEPPKNATLALRLPLDKPQFASQVNKRTDTTTYWVGQPSGAVRDSYYKYYLPSGTPVPEVPGVNVLFLERDRSDGMYLDRQKGKLYCTIEDGYAGENGGATGKYYARSQLTYGTTYAFDTLKTYVEDWKVYFPQDIKRNMAASPNWGRVALKGMHGSDDQTGANVISLAHDSIVYWGQEVSAPNGEISLGSTDDWVNKTHTLREIFREGSKYTGQKAFMMLLLDGKVIYFNNSEKIGKTLMTDYDKITGLYDYRNLIVDPTNHTRNKKFSIVTMNSDIWEMNNTPTVNAGDDTTISSSSITVIGTANDLGVSGNGSITSWQWTKISGGSATIFSSNSASASITGLTSGTYEFRLKATDNSGYDGYDTVKITVNAPTENMLPISNAGQDITIHLPANKVVLSGSGSDSDGTIASYHWTKISGSNSGTINNANSSSATAINLSEGSYQFELSVTDDKGAVGRDTIQVIVSPALNIPPTANGGNDQTIILPTNSVTLTGSGNDADGTVSSYQWTKISGPGSGTINNANSSSAAAINLLEGSYQFELSVTDDKGAVGRDTMQVIVIPALNIPPTANGGNDQTIILPTNSVTLTGSGNDADGTVSSYQWTKISGPASGTINNSNSSSATVTNLTEGVYQFSISVTDDKGAVGQDTIELTVNAAPNIPPTANAGNDETITLPANSITISGSGKDDDGNVVSFDWKAVSGPSGFNIANPSSAISSVKHLVKGVYEFELTVTDDKGAIGKDTVEITVNAAENIAPIANAGTNQLITLPTNNTLLYGSAEDKDGTIESYSWKQISGNPQSLIESPSSSFTNVSDLLEGDYQFELSVTDDAGAEGKDTIDVMVIAPKNLIPTADAGSDQIITLPINKTILSGYGSDEDGTIDAYSWNQLSGPSSAILESASSASTNVTQLAEGSYQFELAVSDNMGAIAKDTVIITVNSANNLSPTADAGTDQQISLPTNSSILYGSGSDVDGTIVNYLWAKISGPSSGAIESPSSSFTNVSGLSEGTYQFELTVTDNNGAVGKDTVDIRVDPSINIAPSADAGIDQIITLPINTITLAGKGIDSDGTISSYLWKQISGPEVATIDNNESSSINISALSEGVYQFQLTVTDNAGSIGQDVVEITVNPAINIAPTANGGGNQTVTLPANTITLSGSGSDVDGTISGYLWNQISGPASATMNSTNTSSANISDLIQGLYQFELTITDDKGAMGKDTVLVKVNSANNIAPTAQAGVDQTVELPVNSVNLSGTGNDVDGNVSSYSWKKVSGPSSGSIENSSSAATNIAELSEGVYEFELTVTDDKGDVGKDTVVIIVNPLKNLVPEADAGVDQVITLPTNIVNLSGIGNDSDGTITNYFWEIISGPSQGLIENSTSPATKISGLVDGVYLLQFSVTDNAGATAKDTIEITVNSAANISPVANAGTDKTITLPRDGVILFGSGRDEDGKISSYSWTQISGPSDATIIYPNGAITIITGLQQGDYFFELAVTDEKGAIGKDTVQLTVKDVINLAPTANAGGNQILTLPTNATTLPGRGVDKDGYISDYAWLQIAGPADATIENPSSSFTMVSDLLEGTYQFELTVTDNKGAIGKDTIEITVNKAKNIPPTANAGVDQALTLPRDGVVLSGTGNDVDGFISAYKWTKVTGPNSGTIKNVDSALTIVSGLSEGIYEFELSVTDNMGATSLDKVQVIVNPAPNVPPTANAGSGKTIGLPLDSVNLAGSGSDNDGTITSYQWTKISGPGSGSIKNANSSSATASNLTVGVYEFELTVTDNKGAIAKDTVEVSVKEALNIAPTANVGNDITITLPINSVTLSGSGKDEDGTIASYQWTKISGPGSGSIKNANSSSATASNLSVGVYEFELTVTDNKGAIAKDTVEVSVKEALNIAPTANVGNDITITLPINSVTLSGSGKDEDGTIASYQWTKISGPGSGSIKNANFSSAAASNLTVGVYEFELIVTDNKGAIAKDTVEVSVKEAVNIAPTANAGNNKTITLPINSVTLSGSGKDEDGTIASYQWSKISGPGSGSIKNANSSSATASNLSVGVYEFELTVTDNKGAIAKDTVEVSVKEAVNIAPTANAGNNKTITLPINSVTLSGSGKDEDGTIASYQWSKISGPGSGSIKNANFSSATASNLTVGVYQFELIVTDNKGAIGKSTVSVTVNPANNIAPIANAGSDKTITLPLNNAVLSGSGKDEDGTVVSYSWKKISGPSIFSLNNASSPTATASGLVEGNYEFELTVTDNSGAIGKSTVLIKVNAAKNIAPTANAGTAQTITLPANSTTLQGSGKDDDGTISSFLWTKISGPANGTIQNGNSSSATVNNLSEGTYFYQLTVTDNSGATANDTVQIVVKAKANISPTAYAGKDTTILSPASTVELNGNGIDKDGEIAAYSWKQISGQPTSVISSANTATTEISELTEGSYTFELTVTDNNGASGKDTVNITVALGRLAPVEINNTITVYPNPVYDITTADINTGRPNTNILMTITDMSGKTVYKKQMVSSTDNVKEEINMSNFSKGTYVITFFFDNVLRKSIKVIKL